MEIVTAVNRPYLRLLDLWLAQSRPYMPSAPHIICMDQAAVAHCDERGDVITIKASDERTSTRDRHTFWLHRLRTVKQMVDQGHEVLHSDLDAFWLAPPTPLLQSIQADLVFSIDMGIPKNILDAWGFVLCCGFFLARPTPATQKLFSLWEKDTERIGDDQIAFNRLIFDASPDWQSADEIAPGTKRAQLSLGGQQLTIVVLPLSRITRVVPFGLQGPLVAHPWFERALFPCYLELMELVLHKFGTLNPKLPEQPSSSSAEPESLDECSLGAVRMINTVLRDEPATAALLTLRGAMYLRAEAHELAQADLSRACTLEPPTPALRIYLAQALLGGGAAHEAYRLLAPLVLNTNLELPTIRQAALLIRQANGRSSEIHFLFKALQAFGFGRAFGIAKTWLFKRFSGALAR